MRLSNRFWHQRLRLIPLLGILGAATILSTAHAAKTWTVNSLEGEDTTLNKKCELSEAISAAISDRYTVNDGCLGLENGTDIAVIQFDPEFAFFGRPQTIQLKAPLKIEMPASAGRRINGLAIQGPGKDALKIIGSLEFLVATPGSSVTLEIRDLSFSSDQPAKGQPCLSGGEGTFLRLDSTKFSKCNGAVQGFSGARVVNSYFLGNRPPAIEMRQQWLDSKPTPPAASGLDFFTVLAVENSAFVDNSYFSESAYGGAISVPSEGDIYIHNSSFARNGTVGRGGAVYISAPKNPFRTLARHDQLVIENSSFLDNTVAADAKDLANKTAMGGAIYVNGAARDIRLISTTIMNNKVKYDSYSSTSGLGGGIYIDTNSKLLWGPGQVQIINTAMSRNYEQCRMCGAPYDRHTALDEITLNDYRIGGLGFVDLSIENSAIEAPDSWPMTLNVNNIFGKDLGLDLIESSYQNGTNRSGFSDWRWMQHWVLFPTQTSVLRGKGSRAKASVLDQLLQPRFTPGRENEGVDIGAVQYIDAPGELQFTGENIEAGSSIFVGVQKVNGQSGPTSVDCVATDGTAKSGTDYLLSGSNINFTFPKRNGFCEITILQRRPSIGPFRYFFREFTLELKNPMGGATISPRWGKTTVRIYGCPDGDTDCRP